MHTPIRRRWRAPHPRYATVLICSIVGSFVSPLPAHAQPTPFDQEFLVTAYYSPLPGQSVYTRGTYEGDLRFNGGGIEGADTTPVYAGMVAAPESYPYGTRIALPGVGVGTVHDRGGRIIEWEGQGIHRIDLWMGRGEEGLARSLEWGARFVRGIAYPPGTAQPEESFDLARFPAPREALLTLGATIPSLLEGDDIVREERSARVSALQRSLLDLGYFDHDITTYFGPVTTEAVMAFQRDAGIPVQADRLTEDIRRTVVLHHAALRTFDDPLSPTPLTAESEGKAVRAAQRLLRIVSAYDGEMTGTYDEETIAGVLRFQQQHGIIGSAGDPGAGVLGPRTRTALLTAWRAERLDTAAHLLLASLGRTVE